MAEKFGARVKRPRCNTTSMIDTSCSRVEEQLQHREGGREAWLTVLGSFLVYYASYGLINSFGFFQTFYEKDFLSSTPPSTISLIGTLQIALMNSLATISGAICDVYGVRVGYPSCLSRYLSRVYAYGMASPSIPHPVSAPLLRSSFFLPASPLSHRYLSVKAFSWVSR